MAGGSRLINTIETTSLFVNVSVIPVALSPDVRDWGSR
jgi:hypothetical protein